MNLFDIDTVTYRFNRIVALDGLSLSIPAGHPHRPARRERSRASPRCSGSSTVSTSRSPAASASWATPLTEARFEDDEFAYGFRRRVGMLFQNPDVQLFNATVFDEVAFGPLQLRWPAGRDPRPRDGRCSNACGWRT